MQARHTLTAAQAGYAVEVSRRSTRDPRRVLTGFLLEHGVRVASFRAVHGYSYEVSFRSTAAHNRFSDWCDSLSIGETIEALCPTV